MILKSMTLGGSARLESAVSGGPPVTSRPPADEMDAIKRIQKALVLLGFPLPISVPNGPGGEPDGIFGPETYNAVIAFQTREFSQHPDLWDGRVGRITLERMDELLYGPDDEAMTVPTHMESRSRCLMKIPADNV
jgi:peptidoglycan hydrolase-like protein with peptidoglycan-binding domain